MHNTTSATTSDTTSEPPARQPGHSTSSAWDAVGNTPLMELTSLSRITGCTIYAKAEFLNPGGSIKDRSAKSLILDAEASGRLPPGGTIVEASSGNMGTALTLLGRERGYKTVITMSDSTAPAKIEYMKSLGADVRVLPTVPLSDPNHFHHVAERLSREIQGAVYTNQLDNLVSTSSHYKSTGPEIWQQAGGKIDGFVSGAGTAGTIAGCSRFFKEKWPDIKVWLVDPKETTCMAEYINSGQTTSFELDGMELVPMKATGFTVVEGVGIPLVTRNLRKALIDKGVSATNQEVVDMAYHLLENEGICVGPSAAMNVVGAVKMARELGPGHRIVTILCDRGDRYQNKLFNSEWLTQQGLLPKASLLV